MQKQTQLANELWPLLLPRVAALVTGAANGGGGTNGVPVHALTDHTGQLADAQAPQFLLRNGIRSLTGNLAVADGVTIDGVDVSAHAADPDAHHARQHSIVASSDHTLPGGTAKWAIVGATAVAVLGLLMPLADVTGATKEAILKSDSSGYVSVVRMNATDRLRAPLLDTATGDLTLSSATGLVNVGSAMSFSTSGNIAVAPDIQFTGNALLATEGDLRVHLDSDNNATGNALVIGHGSPTTTGFVEVFRLNEVGTLRITADNPTISTAANDLTINPASRTLFADDKQIRSQTHTAGFLGSGFSISWPLSGKAHLDIRSIYAEELEVTAFQADIMRLRVAEDFLAQSMGQTSRDFTTPASLGGTVRVYFENNAAFVGQIFLDNEWVMFQSIQRGTGLSVAQIWGQMDAGSYVDEGNGEQSWLFRLRSGPTNKTVNEATIALSFGSSGDGYIHHNVLRNANGPWTRYATWSGANPYTPANRRVHAQAGNLNGLVDLSTNRYGMAAGNNLGLTPTNGFSGFVADDTNGLRLFNTSIALYTGATQTVSIAPAGNVKLGSNVANAISTTLEFTAATGALRIGPGANAPTLNWTGTQMALRNSAAADVITLDSSGGSYFAGVMTIGTAGEIRQGTGTVGTNFVGLRIWRESNVGRIAGYGGVDAGTGLQKLHWYADTAGEMRAGGGVVAVAADGFSLARYATESGTPIAGTESKAALAWWDDINARTGTPMARIYAGRSGAGSGAVPSLSIEVDPANSEARSRPSIWLVGKGATPSALWLVGVNQVQGIPGLFASRNTTTDAETLQLTGRTILKATLERDSAIPTVDLGTAGNPFQTLYVGNIVATTITGASIGGSIWQNDAGDMYIRSSAAATRTLYIANPHASYGMNLDVEGNITVGGTVDGVDVSNFKGLYDTHAANANAHHAQSHALTGSDHTASGLTAGQVLRASGATTFAFAQLQHADLGGITADQHHAQQHVLATNLALGNDHTISGAQAGWVLRASGATAANFAQLAHSDLSGLTIGDPHTQYALRATQVIAGNGLTGGGTLAADRTLTVGAGTLITVNPTNVGLSVGTAQYQVIVTGPTTFTPAYTALSTFAGNGMSFTGGQFVVGATGLGLDTTATQVRLTSSSSPGLNAAILATDPTGLLTLNQLKIGAQTTFSNTGDVSVAPADIQFATSATVAAEAHLYIISDSTNTGTGAIIFSRGAPTSGATESMRITNAGRVGIGNPSPSYPLDVTGDMRATTAVRTATIYASAAVQTPSVTTASGDLALSPATGITTLSDLRATTRLRTPLIDSAAGQDLTIQAAGDLYLYATGNDVVVQPTTSFRSSDFAKSILTTGFRIAPTSVAGQMVMQAGSAEFDELRVRIFVADETRVDRGQWYLAKSYGIMSRPFAVPSAINGTAFIYFEDSPHITGALFSANDWLMLAYVDMAGGGITLTKVWGQVNTYTAMGNGEQRWTFTLRSETPSLAFAKGAIGIDLGASGQGYILMDAVTSTSPSIVVAKWTTNPYSPANHQVLTSVGNLATVGFTGEYGLAASVNGYTTDAPWIKVSTTGAQLNNLPLILTSAGVEKVHIGGWNDVWMGPSSTNKVFEFDGNALKLRSALLMGSGSGFATDALLYCAFDAGDPRFGGAGSANGHLGQPATLVGKPAFRTGKFGGALEATRQTTNLVGNSTFESDALGAVPAGWTSYTSPLGGGAVLGTVTVANEDSWDGRQCMKIVKQDGTGQVPPVVPAARIGRRYTVTVTVGMEYAVSVWVRLGNLVNPTAGQNNAILYAQTGAAETLVTASAGTASQSGWQELRFKITPSTTSLLVYVWLEDCDAGEMYVDAVQVTQTAFYPYWPAENGTRPTSYTTHGEVSGLNWQRFTVSTWFRIADLPTTSFNVNSYICHLNTTGGGAYLLLGSGSNRLYGYYDALDGGGNSVSKWASAPPASAIADDAWHHAALVVDYPNLYLYQDGVLVASQTLTAVGAGVPALYLGANSTASRPWNGWLDDFAIIPRALAANEVAQIAQGGAPIRVLTSASELMLSGIAADGGLNTVSAHSGGLFGRTATPAGVETASFALLNAPAAWGGFPTLNAGDLVLGHNKAGSAAIRYDRVAGSFGFYGNNVSTPKTEILNDGTIKAVNADISGVITVTGGNAATTTALTTGLAGKIGTGGAAADVNANVTTINGGKITANSITASQLNFTPVTSTNVVASINATAEGVRIAGNRIQIDGNVTFTTGYDPTTKADAAATTTALAGKIATGGAAADVNANVTTISGGKITAGSITADRLSVTNLADITGSLVVGSTNKLWLNDSGDGSLAIGGVNKAAAPFRVSATGVLTATGATVSGAITASSGSITGTLSIGAAGELRSGGNKTALAYDGLSLARYTNNPLSTEVAGAIAWWPNLDSRTGTPFARLYAAAPTADNTASLRIEVDQANADANSRPQIWIYGKDTSPSRLWFSGINQFVGMHGIFPWRNPSTLELGADFQGTLTFKGHLLRDPANAAIDIGSPTNKFRTMYVETVSGATIEGPSWSFPGSMAIDAKATGTTTVSITNSSGSADLNVQRNIIVAGTVDGVDVSTFKSAYDALAAAYSAHTHAHSSLTGIGANDHHNQQHALVSTDHTASGLAVGQVVRASGATTFGWAQLQHADLGGLTAGDPHTQYALRSTQVLAGNGLTGGGTLAADRTLTVGAGDLITVGTTTVGVSKGTAQYQVIVTGASPFTPAYTALSTFAGNGLDFTGGKFVVGAGTLVTVGATSVGLANGTAQYQVPVTGASPFTPAYTALSTFAGSGMDFTGGKFAIGAGAGITVGTTSVALTTPGALAVGSTNSASGNHTHAVTTSSSPGAAAAILATSAAGALTLVQLTIPATGYLYVDGVLDFGASTLTEDATYLRLAGTKPLRIDAGGDIANRPDILLVGNAVVATENSLYINVDSTNTGSGAVYFAKGADTSAATILARLTNAGRFGIGVNPSYDLDVAGEARASVALRTATVYAATAVQTPTINTASGDLALSPASGIVTTTDLRASTRVRTPLIDTASGNLSLSPAGGGVQVGAAMTLYTTNNVNTGPDIAFALAGSIAADDGLYLIVDDTNTGAGAFTFAKGAATANTATVLMTLTNGGRLGVGNPSPSYALDVTGEARATTALRTATVYAGTAVQTPSINTASGDLALSPASGVTTLSDLRATTRLRTPLIDTAAATDLTIAPAGDLYLSPVGNDVVIAQAAALRSGSYQKTTAIDGFWLGPTGVGNKSAVLASSGEFDELRARYFVADETRVDRGQWWLTKSYGILSRPFTVPANVGDTASLYVENSPHVAGALFSNNDWVMLTWLDMSGGITLTKIWGQVASYNVVGLTGEQRWTFTLRSGTGGLVFGKGAVAVDFGAVNQGYVLADAVTAASPYLQVGRWTGANPYSGTYQILTQIGRLDGATFTGEYGLAAGVTGFGTDDQWIKVSTAGAQLNNLPLTLTSGGVAKVSIAAWNNVWLGPSSSDKRLYWDGSTLAIAGDVTATAGQIANWSIGTVDANTISSSNVKIVSGDTTNTRIELGAGDNVAGIRGGDGTINVVAFWAGTAHANRTTAPFRVYLDGRVYATSATIAGDVTANTGYIGGASGWVVAAGSISSTNIQLLSGANAALVVGSSGANYGGVAAGSTGTSVVLWAGDTYANRATAPFSVTLDGSLTASKGKIANWNIGTVDANTISNSSNYIRLIAGGVGTARLEVGDGTTAGTGGGIVSRSGASSIVFWAGQPYSSIGSAPFRVTLDGALTATSGAIGGWTIASGQLSSTNVALVSGASARLEIGASGNNYGGVAAGSASTDVVLWAGATYASRATAPFTVNLAGKLTATNADITGTVTATAGAIGGWTIASGQLSSTNVALVSGASARLEVGSSGTNYAGVATGSISSNTVLWAGETYANRDTAPFKVWLNGQLYATNAYITGNVVANSGKIGGSSGWVIAANQITSTNIGLYSGAAGTSRIEVGTGSNVAGMISGTTSADVVMWAGSAYDSRGAANFRVLGNGAVIANALSISYGTVTGLLYAGASAVRLGTDGERLLLPSVTGLDVSTSSSAVRWFPDINGSHDSTKNYTGIVSYRHTTYNVVDMLLTSFVGTGDSASYASRLILQAGHMNGASYDDCRLEVVRENTSGSRVIMAYCNTLWVEGGLTAASIVDRTPHFEGDALAALRPIRGKRGEIDHATLPTFARRQFRRDSGEVEEGRDLGAMVSLLVAAVAQLESELATLKGRGR